jgi:hypothetical protein
MRCRYRDLDLLSPVGRPRPPPQEVRLNRWHENSDAVFPPTNPAHIPAQSPRWRAIQRALKVARARSTVVCSCDALSARASGGALRRVIPMQDRDSVVSLPVGIDILPHMLPAAFFLPPTTTPEASSIRADGPAQNRVAGGHFNARKLCFRLRSASFAQTRHTGSRAPYPYARKRGGGDRCPCVARTSIPFHTHHPPESPRRNPKCAVLEARKAHFAFRPREAARSRHVSHAARIAMPSALQAGRPVRGVGMSPLSRPREPTLRPSIDPVPLQRGTPKGMLPHVAPRRTKCTVFGCAAAGAIERLPDHHSPAAARRSTLAVMLEDEHHREPVNPDAPARCTGTTGLSGQSITTQAAPGETPAYRPQKGNGAVRSRMQSSQVPVAPACHCAVIV